MKIGILTFHSQLNYGGVLQCWALVRALRSQGHEPVVIDRWFDEDNTFLERHYNKWGVSRWFLWAVRSAFQLGDFAPWLRHRRTKRFIAKNLPLTPYHFVDWEDAPKDLGVDVLVVGSDQVWNPSFGKSTRFYLLEGVPMRKIAYAASFGVRRLDSAVQAIYREALSKFDAISCREQEGVALCGELGLHADRVADPTLLIGEDEWRQSFCKGRKDGKKHLVCYLLGEDVFSLKEDLAAFASRQDCVVDIFLNDWAANPCVLPMPTTLSRLKAWLSGLGSRWHSRVKVHVAAGPAEFVSAHANAEWVLTDSFHSLMFATIFGRNCRVLSPKTDGRKDMFGRIEEFSTHASGRLVAISVDDALNSFACGELARVDQEWANELVCQSISWLDKTLIGGAVEQ